MSIAQIIFFLCLLFLVCREEGLAAAKDSSRTHKDSVPAVKPSRKANLIFLHVSGYNAYNVPLYAGYERVLHKYVSLQLGAQIPLDQVMYRYLSYVQMNANFGLFRFRGADYALKLGVGHQQYFREFHGDDREEGWGIDPAASSLRYDAALQLLFDGTLFTEIGGSYFVLPYWSSRYVYSLQARIGICF